MDRFGPSSVGKTRKEITMGGGPITIKESYCIILSFVVVVVLIFVIGYFLFR